MGSPYLTGSLSPGKRPAWGWEAEPRGGEAWLLLQDGRSSRDGGGHRASELPSKTMPTGHNGGSQLGGEREGREREREKEREERVKEKGERVMEGRRQSIKDQIRSDQNSTVQGSQLHALTNSPLNIQQPL